MLTLQSSADDAPQVASFLSILHAKSHRFARGHFSLMPAWPMFDDVR
ncbi:MAG TPA: hypothetical protein VEL75_03880 [Candidatus Methylomirabilis sp.]|nr:hypothetical protein [Candidatus Methylomirabilis sp.]